jgi:hypothetical protein
MHDVGVPGRSRPATHSAVNRVMDTTKASGAALCEGLARPTADVAMSP